MKRILVLVLALILTITLLAACGSNNGSNSAENPDDSGIVEGSASNTSTETKDIIKAADLISNEDAATVLEQNMEDGVITVQKPFTDEVRYESQSYTLHVSLSQEALYDEGNDLQKSLLKDGWTSYMQQMEKAYVNNYYDQNIVEMGGIAGTSYLQEGIGFGTWILHVFYGEYYITLALSNTAMNYEDSEDEILWKHEKLKETGDLAVDRLKTILE